MSQIDLKGNRERLLKACEHLKIASALVYGSASGVTPFRASKFLNVLGKVLGQQELELRVLIGETEAKTLKEYADDGQIWPDSTFPILEALFKHEPPRAQEKEAD